eukprot:maker-scaffold419_size176504-snap-gene-0.32 protein:Tk02012 transcript:maker-scaffold419_size176504-snap-gene-0.32-mRNA-1 annotation:"cd151 antigen-like"
MSSNRAQYAQVTPQCCPLEAQKFVFVIFNLVFLALGLLVGGVGLWTRYHHWFILLVMHTFTYSIIIWLMVSVAILSLLGSALGCIGTKLEQKCWIAVFNLVLILVLVLNITIGMLCLVYHEQVGQDLTRNLKSVFTQSYHVDMERTNAIDSIQQQYKCCGGEIFEDWHQSPWYFAASKRNKVPDSCCKSMSNSCGRRDHPSNIPYTGCRHPMAIEMRKNMVILGGLGLGGSILVMCILLFSLLFFRNLSRMESNGKQSTVKNLEVSNNGYHPVYGGKFMRAFSSGRQPRAPGPGRPWRRRCTGWAAGSCAAHAGSDGGWAVALHRPEAE